MTGYDLQQLVMVSAEVWQDLHARYSQALWPWQPVFVLFNALVLVKSKRRLFSLYVAVCWVILGAYYFLQYVSQVHTFAYLMGAAFIVQGFGLLVFKVVMATPKEIDKPDWINGCGYLVFGITALVPYSYLTANSQASFMLFGWGAEQTAIGTLALLMISLRRKVESSLVIIPVSWLVFSVVAL